MYDSPRISLGIALQAIWGTKLRSFMTVLGNIVAVTSIIAVVSLMQGMNATVKDAIMNQAGADSFRSTDPGHDHRRGGRQGPPDNPRITPPTRRAIERYSNRSTAVMAESRPAPTSPSSATHDRQRQIHGVTADYVEFSGYDAERGRLPSALGSRAPASRRRLGWETGDRLFGRIDPWESSRSRAFTSASSASREEGLGLRPVAGRVRRDPARPVPDAVRLAPLARSTVKPARPRSSPAMDDARVALRVKRHLRPRSRQLRGAHVGHASGHLECRLPAASSRC